jgi:hypothetical protein
VVVLGNERLRPGQPVVVTRVLGAESEADEAPALKAQ